jgi:hypothetical protein
LAPVDLKFQWKPIGGLEEGELPGYYVANPPLALKKYGVSSQQIFASVFWLIDVDIIVR